MSSQDRRVTVERVDAATALAQQAGGLTLKPTTFEGGRDSTGAHKLHRHSYGPSSPCSPHSPRVGETWRTGQTNPYGGWFRPSPSPKPAGMDTAPAGARVQ